MAAYDSAAAHASFLKALQADPKYLPPYDRLAMLATAAQQWPELADITDRLIQLSVYDFPEAYYVNTLANLQLDRLVSAEKSAREALSRTLAISREPTICLAGHGAARRVRAGREIIAVVSG